MSLLVYLDLKGSEFSLPWIGTKESHLYVKNADITIIPLYVMLQSIILTYLIISDGILPSGNLISFRDLPGGNYCHAFQGDAPDRLANYFKDIHRLHQVCLKNR